MGKFKVVSEKSSWLGQIGEFVREEVTEAEDFVKKVVLRMPGSRLVEFDPAHVAPAEEPAETPTE